MSTPRYVLTLRAVGGHGKDLSLHQVSRKLKTVLGDHRGLREEVYLLLLDGGFESLAEALDEKTEIDGIKK